MATKDSIIPLKTKGISSRAGDAYDAHSKYLSQAKAVVDLFTTDDIKTLPTGTLHDAAWLIGDLLAKVGKELDVIYGEVA